MREWLIHWWLDAAFGGVLAMFSISFAWMRKKIHFAITENQALREGIKELLRERIIEGYKQYMALGCWPIYARESIVGMFEQYHVLGGNGVVSDLFDELKTLPTEKRALN